LPPDGTACERLPFQIADLFYLWRGVDRKGETIEYGSEDGRLRALGNRGHGAAPPTCETSMEPPSIARIGRDPLT